MVDRLFSADVARRYRDEVAARFEANRQADAAAIVNMVDQEVTLDPAQQQNLFDSLLDRWEPAWSTGNVIFLYPQYAVLPEPDLLRPNLSDVQQRLWASHPKRRNVVLSWQVYLRTNNVLGVAGLEPYDLPESAGAADEEDAGGKEVMSAEASSKGSAAVVPLESVEAAQ